MTIQCKTIRIIPNPQTMTPEEMGEAMRRRATILKANLPFDLAQAVDIFLDMAMQVEAMHEDLITDLGKADLVADLYRLDELIPD